jgi:DNA-binding response OmpR family regulator
MAVNKVLVVEDDKNLLDALSYNLSREGYAVVTAVDGPQSLQVARAEKPDLIILDIMLPGLSGLEVCRILRSEKIVTPILMLTAKSEETDKVIGLGIGADDYITKPFSLKELLARVAALLRRVGMTRQEALVRQEEKQERLVCAGLSLDFTRHEVRRSGELLDLSRREFELLAFLCRNPGQVFSRDVLLEKVWGYDFAGDTRTVDVHIRWLRQKVEDNPEEPRHIITVRGFGYKFEG